MIEGTKGKPIEGLMAGEPGKRFPKELVRRAEQHIAMLDAATSLNDLATPPSKNLKKLSGDRQHQYAIRINRQWRICFRWDGTDAHDVEIVDYH
ncbi:MAG: type II toxin-antitoxin system RelE/ParE family toxin [Boseongicola sp.]|nr:type II toxin-antitoxin system RelE/ParE family toxin [Boseongicola sp.]MDE0348059.1 type II toxin-antitoxin system RelE/ParE family toxin [Boseongicola sp.]